MLEKTTNPVQNTASNPPPSNHPGPAIPLIELDHASLLYGNVVGVNDAHLRLAPGAYALVGPNGAGKSTLIGLITGALKPTLGRVRVMGRDPFRQPHILSRIGLCPSTDILIHGVSGRKWLELQLALSGWDRLRAKSRVDELIEIVEIGSHADRPLHTYSLGLRQRTKFAQAIAHHPDLLILDEPFNGLDPLARQHLIELLSRWKEGGKSLILANHVLHEVEQVTNSFLLIYGGRILASGNSAELQPLLTDFPQEIKIFSDDIRKLASQLVKENWMKGLRFDDSGEAIQVFVQSPEQLFLSLARWTQESNVNVSRIIGTDGDMSTLFQLLLSRHRGSSATMKGW